MYDQNYIFLKCPNPACGKLLKFKAFPNFREGNMTCPHCGTLRRISECQILKVSAGPTPANDPAQQQQPAPQPQQQPAPQPQQQAAPQPQQQYQQPQRPRQFQQQQPRPVQQAQQQQQQYRRPIIPPQNNVETHMANEGTRRPEEQTRIQHATASIHCLSNGVTHVLKPGANTIGRAAVNAKAAITFADPEMYMSRLHATISFVTSPKPVLHLKDESSANGTYINETRLPAGSIIMLQPDKEFRMGNLRFVCSISTPQNGANSGFRGADRYGNNANDTSMTTL